MADVSDRVARVFAEMDKDNSSAISYMELRKWLSKKMRGDGDISANTVTDAMEQAARAAFAKHRRESDDQLGVEEVAALLRDCMETAGTQDSGPSRVPSAKAPSAAASGADFGAMFEELLVKYVMEVPEGEEGAAPEPQGPEPLEKQVVAAAARGDVEAVEQLVAEGASPDEKNEHGHPLLVLTAMSGHAEATAALARLGANVELPRTHGGTALVEAARNGQAGTVEALLKAGANVNAVGEPYGDTALMLAARCGSGDCAKLLLEGGADKALQDSSGKTALDWAEFVAKAKGEEEVAVLLRG